MKNCESVDSSLGFAALDGLCIATRPGAVDPGVILYFFQCLGLSPKEVETILYSKSDLLGISGVSNNMRNLLASREPGSPPGGGLLCNDARLRTGIERARRTRIHRRHRKELCRNPPAKLRVMPMAWNRSRHGVNARKGPKISRPASRVSAWVIPTNEELMISAHTGMCSD